MLLANALSSLYPSVKVTDTCASSCLLLYLAGAFRAVLPTGRVGVHRPTFESLYLQELPIEEAKSAYAAMETQFHEYVTKNGLPQSLYERLMATASTSIYWLSATDLGLIGVNPPYLQEKILATCSSQLAKVATEAAATQFYECFDSIVDRERQDFISGVVMRKKANDDVWEGVKKAVDEALKPKQ